MYGLLESFKKLVESTRKDLESNLINLKNDYVKSRDKLIVKFKELERKHKVESATLISDFKKLHAKDINEFHENHPHIIDDIANGFGDWHWQDIREELDKINDLQEEKPDIDPGNYSPFITDYPRIIEIGFRYYTIIGHCFRDDQGKVYIEITENQRVIEANVLEWSDNCIKFYISDDVEDIPFSCDAKLYISKQKIGEPNVFIESYRLSVTLEPFCNLHYSASEHFHKYGLTGISTDHTFKSPILPNQYKLFDSTHLDGEGFVLLSWNYSDTDPINIHANGIVYVSDNRLCINVHIGDEGVYNLTAYVRFYIIIPKGFECPPGWNR